MRGGASGQGPGVHFCITSTSSTAGARAVHGPARPSTRRRFVRGREPMDLEGLFERDVKAHGISYQTFRRVYEALGRSFSLDPRLIRPSDSFKDILAFDSWTLWMGQERMEKWLTDNFEVRD